jgi:hypothetical protein
VWWAEARKTHAPQRDRLIRALDRMFALAWPERLDRFVVPGVSRVDADGRWARLNAGERGIIAEGPLFPLRDGHHRMTMRFRGRPGESPCRLRLELTRGMGDRQQLVMASEAASNAEGQASVEIALQESMTFGLRLRVFNLGGGDGEVLLHCECATAAPVV